MTRYASGLNGFLGSSLALEAQGTLSRPKGEL
jgi:hypothetical protein